MKTEFFDITNYNSDTVEIDEFNEDFYGIAEMYFRLDSDEIKHERLVISLMDWLGEIGGITDLLTRIATFILGGYFGFN